MRFRICLVRFAYGSCAPPVHGKRLSKTCGSDVSNQRNARVAKPFTKRGGGYVHDFRDGERTKIDYFGPRSDRSIANRVTAHADYVLSVKSEETCTALICPARAQG